MGDNARIHDHEKLFAADEIGDTKHLKVKLEYGGADSATMVSADNPLPVTLGSESITITGDVNVGTTVSVDNDPNNPLYVTQTPVASSVDAFGKLRVTMPITIGDYYHVSGENPEMLLVTSGSGSGYSDVATSSYVLSVGTGANDYSIHQSRMYHHYLPGKSQLILSSFCFGTSRENTVKRVGYFDDKNGIFFQQNGDGSLCFVVRDNLSGTPNDVVINQSDWNRDTCNKTINGTGVLPSGDNAPNYEKPGTWTLNAEKIQLLMLDFQWLGVGRIRIGFVHDGEWKIAHEIYHSNYDTNVYWNQPNLPIRCEIRNTDAAVGTSTLKQICSTAISEGGYSETGTVSTRNTSLMGRTIVNGGDSLPLIAIKLKNSYNGDLVRAIVRVLGSSLIVTNGPVYFELIRFDNYTDITGGSWTSHASDSVVEYNITATGYSNGRSITGQFLEAAAAKGTTGSTDLVNPTSNKRGFITQNYDSTNSQAYAICATALGNQNNINIKAYASLQWSETR